VAPLADQVDQTKFDAAGATAKALGLTMAWRPVPNSRDVDVLFASLSDATYADWSAQRALDAKQDSSEFRGPYFDPQAHGWFPMTDRSPDQYLIRSLVESWRMLGIVGPGVPRMVVQGGMHTYCGAVERWLRDRKISLHLSTRVVSITRPATGFGYAPSTGTATLYSNRLQSLCIDPGHLRRPESDPRAGQRQDHHQPDFHPPYHRANTNLAVQKLDVIQSKRRTWFCGSFLANPSFMSRQISAASRPRNGWWTPWPTKR
jgi:hypothetical protein